jgi:hypothetical protein
VAQRAVPSVTKDMHVSCSVTKDMHAARQEGRGRIVAAGGICDSGHM